MINDNGATGAHNFSNYKSVERGVYVDCSKKKRRDWFTLDSGSVCVCGVALLLRASCLILKIAHQHKGGEEGSDCESVRWRASLTTCESRRRRHRAS